MSINERCFSFSRTWMDRVAPTNQTLTLVSDKCTIYSICNNTAVPRSKGATMKLCAPCFVYGLGRLLHLSPLLFPITILQSAIIKDGLTVGFGLFTGLVTTNIQSVGRCNKLVCSFMQHSSFQAASVV